jgi:hypothetical protein
LYLESKYNNVDSPPFFKSHPMLPASIGNPVKKRLGDNTPYILPLVPIIAANISYIHKKYMIKNHAFY